MADTIQKSNLLFRLIDPLRPTSDHADRAFRFTAGRISWMLPVGIGIGLLVISAVWGVTDPTQFFFSYLVGWTFSLAVTLGCLFFVLVHHLTKAHWGVVVRRIPEAVAYAFPMLLVLFIPIAFGMHDLYHWTHHELFDPSSPEYDPIIAGKAAYLNQPFFFARLLFYFLMWSIIAYRLYTLSVRQDVHPEHDIPKRQRTVSAWGLPVFAVTTAFASYDLLMSLDPHWFSTIFGVYFFAGAVFAAFAFIAFMALLLQRRGGMLKHTITKEHYHDLGKYMFGFTAFWAYIAFSQYMLIWYGGIPEETVFFRHRLEHGWEYHTTALVFLHFVVPFLILLPRASKRALPLLGVMTVWFFIMQWFDLHWLAMPVKDMLYGGHAGFHLLDFTCWLGLFSLLIAATVYRLSRHSLVPQNDPRLAESLHFENV